jgi:trimeric autotransporter adhesin
MGGFPTTPGLANGAVTTAKLAVASVTEDKIAAGAVTSSKLAAGAVTTTKLDDEAVTTAKIGEQEVGSFNIAPFAITGQKVHPDTLLVASFTGRNGTGACTLTGAKVGDQVLSLTPRAGGAGNRDAFEAFITVADQIQQSSASNLSAVTYDVLLLVQS